MTNQHQGSCLCGGVRFRISGELERFFLCHCTRCRKDSGSAHGANLFSSKASIEWLSGQDTVRTFNLAQTRHTRSFCTNCGSAVPCATDGMLVIPAGSLDGDPEILPNAHIFFASRASWDTDLAGVPSFDEIPS